MAFPRHLVKLRKKKRKNTFIRCFFFFFFALQVLLFFPRGSLHSPDLSFFYQVVLFPYSTRSFFLVSRYPS